MKSVLLPALLIFLSQANYSQSDGSFPSVDRNDLPGATIRPARTFTGSSLFGYIDGGAELYLEYGFSELWVSEIEFMGGKYKTEIYMMNGPEEAFGIFSVSRYRCLSMPPVASYSCQTRHQLQLCSGQFYVSIINSSGSSNDSIASLRIGEAIARKITGPPVDLSTYLPDVSPEKIRKGAIIANGKLGVMNGAPDWEDYFKDINGYSVLILSDTDKTFLSVKFNTRESMVSFASLHNWNTDDITDNAGRFSGGVTIRKLSSCHLLIEIPK
jgi:hypothetical protein